MAMKSTYITNMRFEFGQYMVGTWEAPSLLSSFMKEPVFYYLYLFIKRVRKLVHANILGSKKLPSFIENIMLTLSKDHQLYNIEIYLKALSKNLEPILSSGMVCLNIFEGGVMMYVCLVCLFVYFYGFPISFSICLMFSSITYYWTCKKTNVKFLRSSLMI
jgi:hypothetical protein